MSKKLIAVAAAAALALTGLVAAPANSAGSSLLVDDVAPTTVSQSGLTATTAFEVAVPSQDVLRATDTAARSVLALEVSTRSDNAAVAVTSTGAVKLITAAQLAASTTTTATGTQSLSLSANDSGKVTFYAYNTSTTAGSITVVESGTTPASNTVWVKGTTDANNAYKVNFTVPTVAGLGSKVEFSGTVVDMFGNAITTATVTPETLGGDATGVAMASPAYNTTKKVYEGSFTNRTTAGTVALSIKLGTSANAVTAFGAKTTSQFYMINGADLQAAITALQAEVAALKADYNALANKWNKRVANKKAPKKAVTLK